MSEDRLTPTVLHADGEVPDGLLEAFWAYERALGTDDVAELDRLFAPGPHTLRGDAAGLLVGHAQIAAFRSSRVVTAHGWEAGLSASLAAGLACFLGDEDLSRADCAVITLVDLPELRPAAVRRVLGSAPCGRSLRRAVYDDAPGHPVVVGRDHWAPLLRQVDRAGGDRGAGPYLRRAGCEPVDCTDLGGGCDVDSPPRG